MTDIALRRLRAQRLVGPPLDTPEAVVRWLGAVQAQDYPAAAWALGLRLAGATQAAVDEAFDSGRILRTHVMRPTWHFVAPEDVRALVQLTGPRLLAGLAGRFRRLELDAATISAGLDIFSLALAGGRGLTRAQLGAALESRGISAAGQRLPHLIMVAELRGLVISGPRRGRDFTYVPFEERVPPQPALDPAAALVRLAATYFRSHGPAQVADFAWWSGLTLTQARTAVEEAELEGGSIAGRDYYWGEPAAAAGAGAVHLLPNFDEYTVAYRDRSALVGEHGFDPNLFAFGSVLSNVVTVGGRVRAAWRKRGAAVQVQALGPLGAAELAGIQAGAAELGRFTGRPVKLEIAP